jgi:hypothetical protein
MFYSFLLFGKPEVEISGTIYSDDTWFIGFLHLENVAYTKKSFVYHVHKPISDMCFYIKLENRKWKRKRWNFTLHLLEFVSHTIQGKQQQFSPQ